AKREQLTNDVNNEVVAALVDFGQASSFRRACLSMMAWSLTNEERASVRQAFIQMDEDKTGAIKIWEFKKVLEEKCRMKSEEATKIFQALDTTQTDEIHYSEFLAAMVSTRIALHDDLLLATFKRFDKDNSGRITVENLREVLGETFEGNAVENIMLEADLTGSGDISYEEWIQYLRAGVTSEAHAEMAAKLIDNRLPHDDPNKT
ncbi:CPK12, partial [Symbiodinium sp. KB8]